MISHQTQYGKKLRPEVSLKIYKNLGHINILSTKNEMAICGINCLVGKIAVDKKQHT